MGLVQLRFSSKTRYPLFPDEEHRREAVHALAQVEGRQVMFGFVDEHGHTAMLNEEPRLKDVKHSLRSAVTGVADQPVEPIWDGVLKDRAHTRSFLRYSFNQPLHHGVLAHPALWTGSCFLDLVGARVVKGLDLALFEVLPRLAPADLPPLVDLAPESIRPASDGLVRGLGALRLVQAASSVFAADPELGRNMAPERRARRVAARVGRGVGIAYGELAWALEMAKPSVHRLAQRDIEGEWERAVRIRLQLEEHVRVHMERGWLRRVIAEMKKQKHK